LPDTRRLIILLTFGILSVIIVVSGCASNVDNGVSGENVTVTPSPAPSPINSTVPEGYRSYVNTTAGVSFVYPEPWNITPNMMGSTAIFLNDDGANVILKVGYVPAGVTGREVLQEFVDTYSDKLKEIIKDVSIGEEGLTTFKGSDAYHIKYNQTCNGQEQMSEQLVFIRGGKSYLFTWTVLPENYDADEPEIRYIIDSLEFS
jgi:hypothetical protein